MPLPAPDTLTIKGIHELEQSLESNPAVSLGQDVNAESQKHPGLFRRERMTHARRMRADQVDLKLPGQAET